jgi:hypothetical protein
MPVITRFYGITIKMYFNEHGVPAYSHPSRTSVRNESEQSFARKLNTD